ETLVEQVLLAARLDHTREIPIDRQRIDVPAIVERAVARFEVVHGAHRLATTLAAAEAHADGRLLRRVIDNLLDNAAKYTEPERGPIELDVASDRAGGLRFEVRDRGIGVSDDDLARLFDPFFRTDRSRARGTGGVGL